MTNAARACPFLDDFLQVSHSATAKQGRESGTKGEA